MDDVGQRRRPSALARAIIALGETLGLEHDRRGDREAEQRAALRRWAARWARATTSGAALPAGAIEEILEADRFPRLRLVEDSA